jgi:hypothetical protein
VVRTTEPVSHADVALLAVPVRPSIGGSECLEAFDCPSERPVTPCYVES